MKINNICIMMHKSHKENSNLVCEIIYSYQYNFYLEYDEVQKYF
jgi:hypothetical protein